MTDLLWYQYVLIGLIFIWSSFVRSGLGFGGAVMALPFLLLVVDDPLIFLPIIAIHLLIFSALITLQNQRQKGKNTGLEAEGSNDSSIDWSYLKKALGIMIVPKLIGVFGLLTLPSQLMSGIVFGIVAVYAMSYVLNKPFTSKHPTLDVLFLMLGGYISGTSLIGAPLIVAVFATHVAKEKLRDTLFVLWFILVSIKMSTFIIAGVDLQLIHQLWLFPCAWIGHLIGMRFHKHMLQMDARFFYQVMGGALIITSLIGLYKAFG